MAPHRLVKSANEQEKLTPRHSLNEMELQLTDTDRNIPLFVAAPNLTMIGAFTAIYKKGAWLRYSQPNYEGESTLVNSGARSQAEASITQADIQSVKPFMGQIILYANFNYSGDSLVLTESAPKLGPFNFDNMASSALVISGKWRLCGGNNYQSTSFTTSGYPEALSPIPDLPNNSLSSVEFIAEA